MFHGEKTQIDAGQDSYPLVNQRDPQGEVLSWFNDIREMLKTSP